LLEKIFALSRTNTVGIYRINKKEGLKVKGQALTEKRKFTDKDFADHEQGKIGLGLSPLLSDNTVMWAAIDIDIYKDFSVENFSKKYKSLPVLCCKTKSGGLHIYLFFTKRQKAKSVQNFCKTLGELMGFTDFEIFPKQNDIPAERQANWINLPYFGDTRKCYHNGKPQTMEQFYNLIEKNKITGFKSVLNKFQFYGAPPCIVKLGSQEIVPGYRDIALLNIGVWFREKFKKDWSERLRKFNQGLSNPIDDRELEKNIIGQLEKGKVWYQCKTELKDFCESENCRLHEKIVFKNFEFEKIVKLDTVPPIWKMYINNKIISLTTAELFDQRRLGLIIAERLDKVWPLIKDADWRKIIDEKFSEMEVEEAPEDAKEFSEFLDTVKDFCLTQSNTRDDNDLFAGKVINYKGQNIFRSEGLRKYLKMKGLARYTGNKCFQLIQQELLGGARTKRVGEKTVRVWYIPEYQEQKAEKSAKQKVPDFSKYDTEEEF
jgi:hypothetical protein